MTWKNGIIWLVLMMWGLGLHGQERRPSKPEQEPGTAPNVKSDRPQEPADDSYHTPRAGEALKGYVPLLGIDFEVPERDRSKTTAVSLGVSLFSPKVGDTSFVPFFGFYHTNSWEEHQRRLRMILAGVANFIDFFEGTWNSAGFELVANFENFTIPIPSALEIEGVALEDTKIYWGYVRGGAGLSWRTRVAPWHVDNSFSIAFLYEPGLLYFRETSDTAANYIVPPTTYEDRLHARIRFDALERNIMELRHSGWAFGIDAIRGHRYNWKDHDYNGSFQKKDTETYSFLSGFFTWAGGPDFLGERHRFVFSLYGGMAAERDLDRYSAPRLGGGPGGDESEALSRSPIPGARFDEFIVSRYLLISMEYRMELFFFMYLHIKGMIGPIRRMELDANGVEVSLSKNEIVGSIGLALTTGFAWDSQLYIEYVHERGVIRGKEKNEDGGHNVMIVWSKAF